MLWQQKNFYGKKVNNWNSSLAKHMEQEKKFKKMFDSDMF